MAKSICGISGHQPEGTRGVQLKQELWREHKNLQLINPRKGNHYTGRRCQCPGCEGYLFDSTIDFGDNLPEVHIDRGFSLADQATLCIVLGSRCSVSPACEMPISVGRSGRDLVVVNLQKTSADPHACLRIGATIDQVMVPLMDALEIPIPEFELNKRVVVSREAGSVAVRGIDTDDTPNDLLWNVQVRYGDIAPTDEVKASITFNQDALSNNKSLPQPGFTGTVTEWPWHTQDSRAAVHTQGKHFIVSPDICNVNDEALVDKHNGACIYNAGSRQGALLEHQAPDCNPEEVSSLVLMFRSHYREPPLVLPPPVEGSETLYHIVYNPAVGQWMEPVVLAHTEPEAPVEPETQGHADAPSLTLQVKYQESETEDGKYRCYHQVELAGDVRSVASVDYAMPNQGFRKELHSKTEAPFEMRFLQHTNGRFGPCWGRPHVTMDITLTDGTVHSSVFSDNLPARNRNFALACY